jgi:hypothetical protein
MQAERRCKGFNDTPGRAAGWRRAAEQAVLVIEHQRAYRRAPNALQNLRRRFLQRLMLACVGRGRIACAPGGLCDRVFEVSDVGGKGQHRRRTGDRGDERNREQNVVADEPSPERREDVLSPHEACIRRRERCG